MGVCVEFHGDARAAGSGGFGLGSRDVVHFGRRKRACSARLRTRTSSFNSSMRAFNGLDEAQAILEAMLPMAMTVSRSA